MVVIAIIGILVAAGVYSYSGTQKSARDAKRKVDLEQLRAALEMYRSNDPAGKYPCTGTGPNCSGMAWFSSESGDVVSYNGGDYIPGLVSGGYIQQLPRDPKGGASDNSVCTGGGWKRAYLYLSNSVDYKLLSHCAPESNAWSTTDPYYDPRRPCWAWQASSSLAVRGQGGNPNPCSSGSGW